MSDPVGLSIGTTNLVAARVGYSPTTRLSVLTLYGDRPAEVGPPGESGLVLRGFVERVGDPVPLVAADGSTHVADRLMVTALGALAEQAGVVEPWSDVTIAVPAYWTPIAVRALSEALAQDQRFTPSGRTPRLITDAEAALTALRSQPGLPATGTVALLDFGARGTAITLADAAHGFLPVGETLRYTEFSGDQIDQTILGAVLTDIGHSSAADPSATAAVGSLTRLREQCRAAKEQLSSETAATIAVDLPGYATEVRFTRPELEDLIAAPLAGVIAAVEELLHRNGLGIAQVTAIATVGGGAIIPTVTQHLSQFVEINRAPVVTTAAPALDTAVGAALMAARGPNADATTGLGTAIGEAATTELDGAPPPVEGPPSETFRALAWSQDEEDFAPEPVPYVGENPYAFDGTAARPRVDYVPPTGAFEAPQRRPWYQMSQLWIAAAALIALVALGGAAYTLTSSSGSSTPSSTPTPTTTSSVAPAPPLPPPVETTTEPPPPTTEAPPPPPPTTEYVPPPPPPTTVTITETPAPTTTPPTTTTTTTTPPTTTTTTTPPTTTTTEPTTTTPPPMRTTYINVPFLPPIPIQVPAPAQPADPYQPATPFQ